MPSHRRVVAIISLVLSAFVLSGCGTLIHPVSTLENLAPGDETAERIAGTSDVAAPAPLKKVDPVIAPPAPNAPAADCAEEKCVALTFDDGPGKYTNSLLNYLAKAKVPATFYLLGQNVRYYPDAVARMAKEGHQLGNHTFDHPSITKLSKTQLRKQITDTNKEIKKASGLTPTTFRPPYGARNAAADKVVKAPLVLWDVDTLDWKHHDPAQTVKIALKEVHSGSVILMHDIHDSSVKAVPDLVTQLRKKGYTLVTVDDLFAGESFKDSTAYARRPAGKSA